LFSLYTIKITNMSESGILLDYTGQLDLKSIESLLKKLCGLRDFIALNTLTRKRVYAIVVECLENIYKNQIILTSTDSGSNSNISVRMEKDKIYIVAGNVITDSSRDSLTRRIEELNNMDETDLKSLYEDKINRELKPGENGAGLGFIYMILKSENKIGYTFKPLIKGFLYFEIKISLNKYIMRKLIIEKTSYSPKVVLDPENKIYLIAGESRPPDVRDFYDQILAWLKEFSLYLISTDYNKDPVIFNFNFEYFNSSSGKLILDICKVLAGLRFKGIDIIVKWYYEKEDGDMLEVGQEMSRIVKFPFEYVESEMN
jgi:SiaC family regulatory phosphoprotein/Family of unknown function (DUF6272)